MSAWTVSGVGVPYPPADYRAAPARGRGDFSSAGDQAREVACEPADERVAGCAGEPLRKHREAQTRERERAGEGWAEKGDVFTEADGEPLIPDTDHHHGKKLLRDAGVRDGRLRGARHTAATVLLLFGVPDRIVDSIMGWEPGGAARMRARYMHVTDPMLRNVANQVGKALWGSTDPPEGSTSPK